MILLIKLYISFNGFGHILKRGSMYQNVVKLHYEK